MKSTVVMSTMTIIAICTIPSDAASISTLDDIFDNLFPDNYGRCPTIETAKVDVIFSGSDSSTVKSCASFNFKSPNETLVVKSFRLEFDRSNSGELLSCVSNGDTSMDNLVFPCLSLPHSSSVDSSDGNLKVMLFGSVIDPAGKQDVRCAMYTMINSMNYLMAISSNASCDGLEQMLSNQPEDTISNVMLPIDESKINGSRTPSTTNTKNTIIKYSGSRFYWRTG